MAKRVLVLTLSLLLIASLSAFGAKKPLEKKVLPSMEKMKPVDESIIFPYRPSTTLEPKFFFPMTDDTVGWTYYDYQDNSSAHRRVAYDYLGNLHFDWMNMVGPDLSENRYIDYNARYPDGSWLNPGAGVHVTQPAGRGGYCGLDILPDSREVLAFHDIGALYYSCLAIEKTTPGLGQFNIFDVRDANQGAIADDHCTWPMIGTSKHASTTYIHVTNFAQNDYAGYQRCYEVPPDSLVCQSPGWTDTVRVKAGYKLEPNGKNKHPYYFNGSQNGNDGKITYIAGPVATSPTGSGHVAIAWFDQTASVFYQGEIYYLESTTDGDDWMAGNNLTPIKMTHWGDNNWEDYNFYYTEMAAVYDYDNVLHVFFTASATGNEGEAVTLFHWSSATDSVHKVASRLVTADCGNWSYGIAKPTAGVEYQTGDAAYNYLYVVYSGFNDDDVSLAGFANADIYKKVSATGGRNWGPEINLTNTNTDGCDVGECESEAWPSVAERVGNYMYVSYVYDLDAAGAITPQGGYTLDPFRYLKDPRELVAEVPGKDFTPMMMISPVRWAKNLSSTNDALTFANTGTATLWVKVTPLAPYVTAVPNHFSIPQLGAPVTVNLTFSGAGKTDTFLVDQIMIESNNGLEGGAETYVDSEYVKFHFVVTDTFYYAEWDTVVQGDLRASISNVGNIGNQEDGDYGNGMFHNGHNYLFEFTPVFATDEPGYGKIGFTWLHDNHDFLPEAHVETYSYPDLKTQVVYDKMALLFPGRLEAHGISHSRWFYWTKYSKFVISSYDSLFVIQATNWYLYNPPPVWWDDIAPGNPAAGYFGIAADWDVPAKNGSDNWGGYEDSLNLLWQKGDSAAFVDCYGGFIFLDAEVKQGGSTIYKGTAPLGAHVQNNATQLYPNGGFNDDSLWKQMDTPGWSVEQDSAQDMSMVMSMAQVTSPDITTQVILKYALIVTDKGIADLRKKARYKISIKIGDANMDGKVTVSDVVYLINYLFKGGPEPWKAYSDANGDGKVTVSDVVYLINYLFKGGPPLVDPAAWCKRLPPW